MDRALIGRHCALVLLHDVFLILGLLAGDAVLFVQRGVALFIELRLGQQRLIARQGAARLL